MLEFEAQFKSESDCVDYLEQFKWPQGFVCPRCGCEKYWRSDRRLYLCRGCEMQISLTSGTIFHQTRKPLMMWFRAMWYATQQKYGVSALGLQRALGLASYNTAWSWLHKLRCAMVRPGRDHLKGTVEVDETYVGGVKTGKRGRGASGKTLVLIAVEDPGQTLGRIRLRHIPDAGEKSLLDALKTMVEPGSTIRTDGWAGYANLSKNGFGHQVVDGGSCKVGEDLLPLAHRVAALLKRWLLGTHQGAVNQSHLAYYLDEFTFRFNRRTSASRGLLFQRLVEHAMQIDPVYNKSLKGGNYDKNHS
jgi:transposase-like protein